jgi:hypothetical protein
LDRRFEPKPCAPIRGSALESVAKAHCIQAIVVQQRQQAAIESPTINVRRWTVVHAIEGVSEMIVRQDNSPSAQPGTQPVYSRAITALPEIAENRGPHHRLETGLFRGAPRCQGLEPVGRAHPSHGCPCDVFQFGLAVAQPRDQMPGRQGRQRTVI